MELWNREDLYVELWEQPALKVAEKYGISSVALAKVCRKLCIPVPGRGYWARKRFGKVVKQVPLPKANNLPVVQRFKSATSNPFERVENSNPDPP